MMEYYNINSKLEKLESLSDPHYFIKEEKDEDVIYHYWFKDRDNYLFSDLWKHEYNDIIKKLVYYCGENVFDYAFTYFYEEFKDFIITYFIDGYTRNSSPKIREYFLKNQEEIFYPKFEEYPKSWRTVFRDLPPRTEYVYQMFNRGLCDFLQAKTTELHKRNEVVFLIRTRRCIISDELFRDNHGGSFRVKNSRTRLDWDLQDYKPKIAPWLFDSFRRIGSNSEVKDSLADLRELLELLGYIPSKNATLYSMYCNISRDKFVKFIHLQKKTFWPIRYSMVYGNWLNAVVATGYLGKEGFKKTLYGYKVIAKDGHVCNSFAEKIIDDWLYNNNIEHEKEPAYPDCIRDFLNSKVRADWKIGDIYIEYFGLQTNKDYAKKTEDKIMSCQLKGVSLLPLYPGDEFHLDEILKKYIK